ncbi:hypothetical protein IWQ60_010809 [Tieghemiomyces parasiticus]|uniref:Uncharacterized protein n=1 Tax=Tieghemiomyces parasiticus TaxID=78921 RepID=A0A9W8DMA6_9FUNG|nr:hypothetical protein IWQ60_010809 [Tieghemiomyces parasiticus]
MDNYLHSGRTRYRSHYGAADGLYYVAEYLWNCLHSWVESVMNPSTGVPYAINLTGRYDVSKFSPFALLNAPTAAVAGN